MKNNRAQFYRWCHTKRRLVWADAFWYCRTWNICMHKMLTIFFGYDTDYRIKFVKVAEYNFIVGVLLKEGLAGSQPAIPYSLGMTTTKVLRHIFLWHRSAVSCKWAVNTGGCTVLFNYSLNHDNYLELWDVILWLYCIHVFMFIMEQKSCIKFNGVISLK